MALALQLFTSTINPDGSRTAVCSELRIAVSNILEVIDSKSIDRTRYTASAVPVPGAARMTFSTLSGIRIRGEPHMLRTGLDLCQLVRQRVDDRGNWWEVEHRDIRGIKQIDTDNVGAIIIKESKRATALKSTFRKLRTFLGGFDGDTVMTIQAGG